MKSLETILEQIEVVSPFEYRFGHHHLKVTPELANQMAGMMGNPQVQEQQPENYIDLHMQMFLYAHTYCRPFTGEIIDFPTMEKIASDLLHDFSQQNSSKERWDIDWKIIAVESNGSIRVERDGVIQRVQAGQYVSDGDQVSPAREGNLVKVYHPRESLAYQPGYYYVFGEAVQNASDEDSLIRFYFNVNPKTAVELVKILSEQLNRFQVPFHLKLPIHKEAYCRVDTGVMYLARRYYDFVVKLLTKNWSNLEPLLEAPVPLFSYKIAPGIGFAEDPGSANDSFGLNRCRLMAKGVWQAFRENVNHVQGRTKSVLTEFEKAGVRIDRPYLNPGTRRTYLPLFAEISN